MPGDPLYVDILDPIVRNGDKQREKLQAEILGYVHRGLYRLALDKLNAVDAETKADPCDLANGLIDHDVMKWIFHAVLLIVNKDYNSAIAKWNVAKKLDINACRAHYYRLIEAHVALGGIPSVLDVTFSV